MARIGFDEFYGAIYGDRWTGLRQALLPDPQPEPLTGGLLSPYFLDAASVTAAKALGVADGERRLTDVRHIGQALHTAAVDAHLGPAALVEWLRHRIDEAGEDRYWLLETIREYTLARLDEVGEGETVRARHRDYFLALAEQAVAGSMLAAGWLPRLSAAALAGTVVPTTVAAHRFWEESDADSREAQRDHFLKNAAILGGLILAATERRPRPRRSLAAGAVRQLATPAASAWRRRRPGRTPS